MTYRDPLPALPNCPVCDDNSRVKAHDNPHQGRWLCQTCWLLFDGTSAEWIGPRERAAVGDGIERARAALKGGNDGA